MVNEAFVAAYFWRIDMFLIARVFSLLLVVTALTVVFVAAQQPSVERPAVMAPELPAPPSSAKNKETEKQQIALLEQIAKDADALRLPENRALVTAKLAEGFWRYDEKRARALFQTSVNELVAAQTQAEANKKQASNLYSLVNGVSPRHEILTMIAARDAEFALEALYKSRPAKIAQILGNPEEMKKPTSQQSVQTEIYFEQSLITRVSEQSPQRALKLIRESLAKGVTYEALGMIEKLKEKDMELAVQIAGEVADKLLGSDFDKQNQDFGLAQTFLAQYGRKPEENEKIVKVEEKKLRDLAAIIAKSIFKVSDEEYFEIESLLPIMERFSPENVAALKQKKARFDNTDERREYMAYEKFMESEPSPEKLMSEAEKFPEQFRNQMYYAAAEKFAQNGNVTQAQKIISSKMSQEDSENYLTQINYNLISKAIGEGKFDEAGLLINQIPAENSRFGLLMQLAMSVYQKNPAENKKQTLAILDQARALIAQPAETLEDMSYLMQLGITLAEIEPEQSFQTVEAMTFPINEYVEASVIVSKYRNEGTMRQGEMLITPYGGINGFYNLNSVLTTLKNKDFSRTLNFVNGFQRMEVRLSLLLQLIETTPPNNKMVVTPTVSSGG
jgi:hypothetical protein